MFFSFVQGKMLAPKNPDGPKRSFTPKHTRLESGTHLPRSENILQNHSSYFLQNSNIRYQDIWQYEQHREHKYSINLHKFTSTESAAT